MIVLDQKKRIKQQTISGISIIVILIFCLLPAFFTAEDRILIGIFWFLIVIASILTFYSPKTMISSVTIDEENGVLYKTINNKTIPVPLTDIKSCINRGCNRYNIYNVYFETIQTESFSLSLDTLQFQELQKVIQPKEDLFFIPSPKKWTLTRLLIFISVAFFIVPAVFLLCLSLFTEPAVFKKSMQEIAQFLAMIPRYIFKMF